MINFLKKLFCVHVYEMTNIVSASLREGNDNLEITTKEHTCVKCGQVSYKETVHRIESNWYKEEK